MRMANPGQFCPLVHSCRSSPKISSSTRCPWCANRQKAMPCFAALCGWASERKHVIGGDARKADRPLEISETKMSLEP
jgi:hypothetical protein